MRRWQRICRCRCRPLHRRQTWDRSGGDLLERKGGYIRSILCMLDSDRANIAIAIEFEKSVLVEILGIGYFGAPKLDIKRVGILKIRDLHIVNLLSKNAL